MKKKRRAPKSAIAPAIPVGQKNAALLDELRTLLCRKPTRPPSMSEQMARSWAQLKGWLDYYRAHRHIKPTEEISYWCSDVPPGPEEVTVERLVAVTVAEEFWEQLVAERERTLLSVAEAFLNGDSDFFRQCADAIDRVRAEPVSPANPMRIQLLKEAVGPDPVNLSRLAAAIKERYRPNSDIDHIRRQLRREARRRRIICRPPGRPGK